MITFINTEHYKAIPKDEYDKMLASKDEYILDAKGYTYESLDGSIMYVPTVEEFMRIETEQLYDEYLIEKELEEELNWG